MNVTNPKIIGLELHFMLLALLICKVISYHGILAFLSRYVHLSGILHA